MSDTTSTAIVAQNDNGKSIVVANPKNKHGRVNLFRVALYMIRRKSNEKPKSLRMDVASKGMWKKLVGFMRPLHLQDNNRSPKHALTSPESPDAAVVEHFEDVFPPPMSPSAPCTPCSPSSSCSDTSSRYASALNLQELDKSGDCDAEIEGCGEDLMIDAKAEQFIAQFYQQLKIQRLNSINNRYNEMSARGLR